MTPLDRLKRIFPERQAREMAAAGFDVVDVVPVGWAHLPVDEHLALIGGDR